MPGWGMPYQSVATGSGDSALLSLSEFRKFSAAQAGPTPGKRPGLNAH